MSTEHTPGPWHPRTQRVAIGIYSESGELIATVTPGRESKTADARLIADAPLMLQRIERMTDELRASEARYMAMLDHFARIEAVVLQRELDEVLAERTALLEALIGMEVLFAPLSRDCTQHDAVDRARAAIAFVTGEKK